MTRLSLIRDAIIERLNGNGAPQDESGQTIETTKRRWSRKELPAGEYAAAAFFQRERPERIGGRSGVIQRRRHTIAVQCVTAVVDPADIDDALERYRDWTIRRLGDNLLGELLTDIEEGETVWETSNDFARFHGLFMTLWIVEYQTLRNDPTRPS